MGYFFACFLRREKLEVEVYVDTGHWWVIQIFPGKINSTTMRYEKKGSVGFTLTIICLSQM